MRERKEKKIREREREENKRERKKERDKPSTSPMHGGRGAVVLHSFFPFDERFVTSVLKE